MLKNNKKEEFRYNWMRFAEIESNVNIVSLFDLDSQDMDRNHD